MIREKKILSPLSGNGAHDLPGSGGMFWQPAMGGRLTVRDATYSLLPLLLTYVNLTVLAGHMTV